MCEAHAYLASDGGQEKIMENVVTLNYDGDDLVLRDLFGDEKRLKARIREIALLERRYPLSPQEPPARTATRCSWNSPCTPQQGAQPHEEQTRDGKARVTRPSLPRILLLAETLNRPVLPPETAGFEIPANPRPPYPTSAIP